MGGEKDNTTYGFAAGEVKRLAAVVRAYETGGALGGGVEAIAGQTAPIVLAKLTSRDATDHRLYAWDQARLTAAGWEIVTEANGGLKPGTVGAEPNRPAIDLREAAIRWDMSNHYVAIVRGVYRKSVSGTITALPCWYIVTQIEEVPQYQFMQRQAIAANQMGWDFNRSHPMMP